MSTKSDLLAGIPPGLRDPLIEEYRGIVTAFNESRWKLSVLDAGRFCEIAFSILKGQLDGAFPATPSKPSDFPGACKALESKPPITTGDRSIRILIPRTLPALYEIRNNRNVGHVGGDVRPNKMDAAYVRDAATWVMAELVRVFHRVSTDEAQHAVDSLVERRTPLIWEQDGILRVLDATMATPDRVLVLLHRQVDWCDVKRLVEWTKYGNPSRFRAQILGDLDRKLLVEYSIQRDQAMLTPLGVSDVENRVIPNWAKSNGR